LTSLPPIPTLSHAPALSVKQPWAELILDRRKQVEIRSWSSRHRGPLWLHTGRAPDLDAAQFFGLGVLPLGCFVGLVEVLDIVPLDPDRWHAWRPQHLSPGSWRAGLFGWMIANPIRLRRPVPAAGQTGLFAVTPQILEMNLASLIATEDPA
jgi:hypothetical protein